MELFYDPIKLVLEILLGYFQFIDQNNVSVKRIIFETIQTALISIFVLSITGYFIVGTYINCYKMYYLFLGVLDDFDEMKEKDPEITDEDRWLYIRCWFYGFIKTRIRTIISTIISSLKMIWKETYIIH